jgi:hypothetical protein
MTSTDTEQLPWGYAPDRRGNARDADGKPYTEHAVEFLKEFPIGSTVLREPLDEWLIDAGLLDHLPEDTEKGSKEWYGHAHHRGIVLRKFNDASVHPRMHEHGVEPFVLAAVRDGYEVTTPASEVINGKIARKFQSITKTKREQLITLLRASDWSQVPMPTKLMAWAIYDDIEAYARDVTQGADIINNKLSRLHSTVQKVLGRPVDLDARWAEMDAAGGYTDETGGH